jgi:hypothetical protein
MLLPVPSSHSIAQPQSLFKVLLGTWALEGYLRIRRLLKKKR